MSHRDCVCAGSPTRTWPLPARSSDSAAPRRCGPAGRPRSVARRIARRLRSQLCECSGTTPPPHPLIDMPDPSTFEEPRRFSTSHNHSPCAWPGRPLRDLYWSTHASNSRRSKAMPWRPMGISVKPGRTSVHLFHYRRAMTRSQRVELTVPRFTRVAVLSGWKPMRDMAMLTWSRNGRRRAWLIAPLEPPSLLGPIPGRPAFRSEIRIHHSRERGMIALPYDVDGRWLL